MSNNPQKERKRQLPNTSAPTATPDFRLPPVPPRRAQGLHLGIAVAAYLQGATHVRDFCQELGVTAYKAGLSARREVGDRVTDLRRMPYGGILADLLTPAVAVRVFENANEWFLSPLSDDGDPRVAEALGHIPHGEIVGGTVNFRLPPDLPFVEVERAFNAALAPRNFNAFLASEDGAKRLVDIGLPATARLYTDYDLMGRARRSIVRELVCIRPRKELHVLVQALRFAIERVRAARTRARN